MERIGLWFELVSCTPDGQNMPGIGGIFFNGVPDAVDVDGDSGCIAEGFHAPDTVLYLALLDAGFIRMRFKRRIFPYQDRLRRFFRRPVPEMDILGKNRFVKYMLQISE